MTFAVIVDWEVGVGDALFYVGLTAYAACVMWLIVAALGITKATFRDPNEINVSWKRVWLPATLAGLFGASAPALLPGVPPPSVSWRLTVWLILAVGLTAGCFLSAAIMMSMAKWGKAWRLRTQKVASSSDRGPR